MAGATLLGWLVFVWARALYGGAGGLLALTLPRGAEAGLRAGKPALSLSSRNVRLTVQ